MSELAERRMPPAARSTVELLRARGHTVLVREQCTGSLRYSVLGVRRELTALELFRFYERAARE